MCSRLITRIRERLRQQREAEGEAEINPDGGPGPYYPPHTERPFRRSP